MQILDRLYILLDALLIAPYRLVDTPIIGFYLGTFVLCLWCVLLGELTYRLVVRANARHISSLRRQAVRMHNLSIKAISVKDKENYRSCNREANEAFGKYFFNMVTQGAAYLWPLPFALAWMGTRFSQVSFELPFNLPLVGDRLGFAAVPVVLYILCRIIWARLKPLLPFFRHDPRLALEQGEEEMLSWRDLGRSAPAEEPHADGDDRPIEDVPAQPLSRRQELEGS